jgi:hypothetical protein
VTTFRKTFATAGAGPLPETVTFEARSGAIVSNRDSTVINQVPVNLALTTDQGPTALPGAVANVNVTASADPMSTVELFSKFNGAAAVSAGVMTEVTPTTFTLPFTLAGVDFDAYEFYAVADGRQSNTVAVDLLTVVVLTMASSTPTANIGETFDLTATASRNPASQVELFRRVNNGSPTSLGAMAELTATTFEHPDFDTSGYADGDVLGFYVQADGETSNTVTVTLTLVAPVLTISTDDPDNNVTVGDPVTVMVTSDIDPVGPVELHYILNGGTQTDLGPMTEVTPLTWADGTDTDLIPVDSVYDLWATADGAESNHITVTIVAVVTNEITLTVTPDTVAVLGSVEAHASSPEDTGEIYVLHTSPDGATWDAGTAMVADAGTVEFDATLTVATADVGDLHMQARSAGLVSNTVIVGVGANWILAPVAENPVVGTDLPVTINDTLFANPTETVSLKVKVNDGAEQSFPATYVSQGVWEVTVPGATFVAVDDAVEMWAHVLAGDQRGPSTDLVVQATPPPPPFTTLTLEGPAGGQSLSGDPFTLSATADGDPADPVVFFQSIDGGSTWADIGGTEDGPLTFSRLIDSTFAAGSTSHYEARSGAVVSNRIAVYFYTSLGTLVMDPPGPVGYDEWFEPILTTAASLPGRMMFTWGVDSPHDERDQPIPNTDNKPMSGAHPTYTWGTLSGLSVGDFDEDGGTLLCQSYQENDPKVRSNVVPVVVNPGTPNPASGLGTISTVPTTFAEGDLSLAVTVVNLSGMFLEPVNLYIEINDGPPTLVAAMGGTAPTWTYTFNAPDWVAGDEVVLWARDSDETWGAFPAGWKSGSVVLIVQPPTALTMENTIAEMRDFAAEHDPPIHIPSDAKKADILALIQTALAADSTEEN